MNPFYTRTYVPRKAIKPAPIIDRIVNQYGEKGSPKVFIIKPISGSTISPIVVDLDRESVSCLLCA